jgi:hypothetical protein
LFCRCRSCWWSHFASFSYRFPHFLEWCTHWMVQQEAKHCPNICFWVQVLRSEDSYRKDYCFVL